MPELSDDSPSVLGDAVDGAEKPVDSIAPAREAPDRSASTTADNLQITSFIELGIQEFESAHLHTRYLYHTGERERLISAGVDLIRHSGYVKAIIRIMQ